GGLKGCEKTLGVTRRGVEDVNGFMAVLLWEEYNKGNDKALETLLAYNVADAVNLEILSVKAYNMYLKDTPFSNTLRLEPPAVPKVPYHPDVGIIKRLQPSLSSWC
ncbi:MAG: ribonuclease H-like domain-containing protein, partial [Spirochaetia bacterium]